MGSIGEILRKHWLILNFNKIRHFLGQPDCQLVKGVVILARCLPPVVGQGIDYDRAH